MNKSGFQDLQVSLKQDTAKKARDRIFGDIDTVSDCPASISTWFDTLFQPN